MSLEVNTLALCGYDQMGERVMDNVVGEDRSCW